ncbi:MAG: TetR/AcrR family transcriptional regulator [Nitrospinota bacterium]|nr:TetR/AcrR family transcriptional regulator [Nitrospinota bacterium]
MTSDEPKKKDDVLSAIMDAAIKNFAEKGYEGARVDEIAHDAGVNKATIYYHIGDKEALYKAVLSQVLSTGADLMAQNVAKAVSSKEKINTYVETILNGVLAGREDFTRIMMREMAGGGVNIPPEVMKTLAEKILGAMAGVMAEGVQNGALAPANPILLHMMIVGGIAFMRSTEQLRAKHAPAGAAMDPAIMAEMRSGLSVQISKILLYGLMPRPKGDIGK